MDRIVSLLEKEDVNLGLLYIEEPDHTGHMFGPDSREVNDKLEELNDVIGYLISRLKAADLYDYTNLIVTSDHGMAELSEDRLILLDEIEDFDDLVNEKETFITTTSASIQPRNDSVKELLYQVMPINV